MKKFLFTLLIFGTICFSPVSALGETSGNLRLVGQSPWVTNGEVNFDLRVSGFNGDGVFRITAHEPVTRTALNTLKEESELFSPISDPLTVSLKERLNSSGVASLQVSISSTSENEPDFVLTPGMVYPFTIELVADSGDVIDQILTPVIFTSEENRTPLQTTLSLIINGPPPLQPDGNLSFDEATLESLQIVSDAVNTHPEIPVGLQLPPAIIVELARSNELSHTELSNNLSQMASANIALFSTPFVSADPEAWRNSGNFNIYAGLVNHGDIVLEDRLGLTPDRSVLFLSSTAKGETLDQLTQLGSNYFLVDPESLIPRSIGDTIDTTSMAKIIDGNGEVYPARVIDQQLNGHLTSVEDPILGMQFLLADLALISWSSSEDSVISLVITNPFLKEIFLIDALLENLTNAPFVKMAHLSETLSQPIENAQSFDLWPQEVFQINTRAYNYELMTNVLDAYYSILGISHPDIASLASLVETSAAAELSETESDEYLGAFYTIISKVSKQFTAPEEQSVRLTSRQAEIPFTIENQLDNPANVSIHLKSDGRIRFPEGETVNTTLLPGNNRISLLVEARASGDSQIEIRVYSPDENNLIELESTRILIRTTKLSGVGVFLLIIALGVIAFWWFRSNRTRNAS